MIYNIYIYIYIYIYIIIYIYIYIYIYYLYVYILFIYSDKEVWIFNRLGMGQKWLYEVEKRGKVKLCEASCWHWKFFVLLSDLVLTIVWSRIYCGTLKKVCWHFCKTKQEVKWTPKLIGELCNLFKVIWSDYEIINSTCQISLTWFSP